jgi:hypothetical protein
MALPYHDSASNAIRDCKFWPNPQKISLKIEILLFHNIEMHFSYSLIIIIYITIYLDKFLLSEKIRLRKYFPQADKFGENSQICDPSLRRSKAGWRHIGRFDEIQKGFLHVNTRPAPCPLRTLERLALPMAASWGAEAPAPAARAIAPAGGVEAAETIVLPGVSIGIR